MIEFESLLAGDDLRHALLLTYTANLSHFEYAVLPRLDTLDGWDVSLLVDPAEYEQCFWEAGAVGTPGVQYSLYPVHLSDQSARFHPKVYILIGKDSALVVVSSANLTIYGCRDNLEITDVLTSDRDPADQTALRDCAAFLGRLSDSLRPLPERLEKSLAAARKALLRHADANGGSDSGARLLHTLSEPLIEQIRDAIPPHRITRLTIVAPFFDPMGDAVSALARIYEDADLQVIISSPEDANLDGRSLSHLQDRIGFEQVTFPDGRSRWLHAKLYIFEAEDACWVLSGSANASASAWLRSTQESGNAEVVVLREAALSEVARLRDAISTTPLSLADLVHKGEDDDVEATDDSRLRLMGAEEQSGKLEILTNLETDDVENCSTHVSLQGRGLQIVAPKVVVRSDSKTSLAKLFADFGSALEREGDHPLVAHVQLIDELGSIRTGRVWVNRTQLLSLSGSERAVRRTLSRLERGRFGAVDDYRTILDLVARFASQLSPMASVQFDAQPVPGGDTASESAEQTQQTRPLSIDRLRMGMDEMRLRSHGPASVRDLILRAIQGFDRYLASLVAPDAEMESGLVLRDESEGDSSSRDAASRTWKRSALDEFVRGVSSLIDDLDTYPAVPELASPVLELADILLRLIVHLDAHIREESEPDTHRPSSQAVLRLSLKLLGLVFSVRGSVRGKPRGWLIRAWLSEPTTIEQTVSEEQQRLESIVSYAIVAAHLLQPRKQDPSDGDGEHADCDARASSALSCALVGIQLLAGATDVSDVFPKSSRLSELGGLLGDAATEGALHGTIEALKSAECPTLRIARWWLPFLALHRAEIDGRDGERLELLEEPVRQRSPELLKYYRQIRKRAEELVTSVRFSEDDESVGSCGYCNEGISIGKMQSLRAGDEEFQICDACGALLIPVDPKQEALQRILPLIEPSSREWFA